MPAKSKTTKKRSKKTGPKERSMSKGDKNSRVMTTYVPYFRRINAARHFTKVRVSFQGYIPITFLASSGYFNISSAQFASPFFSSNLFTNAVSNGGGVTTGGTTLSQTYPGYSQLSTSWNGYRIHNRKLTVTCIPSLAGDQVNVAMFPSTLSTPPSPINYATVLGQSRGKGMMCVFGGQAISMSYKHSIASLVGLTDLQWSCQPPNVQFGAPTLPVFDYIYWATVDGGSLAGNLIFTVSIEIDIELSEALPQPT